MNIALRATVSCLILCLVSVKANASFALLNSTLSNVEVLECEAIMKTKLTIESAPGENIPDLVVNAVWFRNGRYSYSIMSEEDGSQSKFRCVFDGNRYQTVASGEKSMLTTGGGDKKFHAAAMAGITPLFEPLRYLRPTDERLSILDNNLQAISSPLNLPTKEASVRKKLASGKTTVSIEFKAKDGPGRYVVYFDEKTLFPRKTELINALTGDLLSSCEVDSFERVKIDADGAIDFPNRMTIKNFHHGELTQEIEVTLKNIKINSPLADSYLEIDQSKINFVGDSDSNTIIPVGR